MWRPTPLSLSTRLVLGDLIARVRRSLRWFVCLPILLLPLLVRLHPRFIEVVSSAPALYAMDEDVLEEGDVVMIRPLDMGTVSSRLMHDVLIACGAKHEDSPFWVIVIGLSFYFMACLGSRVSDIFPFIMYLVRFLL